MGITWGFDTKFMTPKDVAKAAVPKRSWALPSWTWCGWTHASPSLYPIKWRKIKLDQGPLKRDMVHDMTLSLEFESGTILSWSRDADLTDLAQKAMLMGNVHYLHVVGWITNFPIPVSLMNKNRRQLYGSYETELVTMQWLLRLAEEQGMNVTDSGEYIFKVWIYASVEKPFWMPGFRSNDVHMMLLGETSDSTTFERIDVCRIKMESQQEDKEEWKRKSVMDIGKMLGWEWKAFKLA